MKHAAHILLGLTLSLTWVASAEAQDAPHAQPSTDREARALFDAGSVAFGEGRYESALRHFENAYALSPRPGMLFNIATAYDRLHRDREALDHFRRYVDAIPDAPNRAEAEARISALEASMEVIETPTDTLPIVPASSDSNSELAPIVLLITGGALIVGGAVTLTLGLLDASDVENARDVSYDTIRGAYERAPILQGVGAATLGVGVALAAVGGLMLSLSTNTETRISLLPNGVSFEGTF